jgi:hypothetical protein
MNFVQHHNLKLGADWCDLSRELCSEIRERVGLPGVEADLRISRRQDQSSDVGMVIRRNIWNEWYDRYR